MNVAVSIAVACLAVAVFPTTSHAQAYLSSQGSAAVDAKGIRHRGSDHPTTMSPWMMDCINVVAPDYPYSERSRRHVGAGNFRLILDLKTGTVTKIIIARSTGYRTLDNLAVAALSQWRWKPGRWKEIDTGCQFTLDSPRPLPPGSVRLPSR